MRIVNKYGETIAELQKSDDGYGYFTDDELSNFGDILFCEGDEFKVVED